MAALKKHHTYFLKLLLCKLDGMTSKNKLAFKVKELRQTHLDIHCLESSCSLFGIQGQVMIGNWLASSMPMLMKHWFYYHACLLKDDLLLSLYLDDLLNSFPYQHESSFVVDIQIP